MRIVTVRELRSQTKALLDAVEAGETIRIRGRDAYLMPSPREMTSHGAPFDNPAARAILGRIRSSE